MTEEKSSYELSVDSAKTLLMPIEVVSSIIDEANFTIDEEGLKLLHADRTMVAVMDMHIKADAFESISGSGIFSLNTVKLKDILKRLGSEPVTITSKEGTVIIQGKNRKFELRELASLSTDKPPTDKLEYEGRWTVPGEALWESITDADLAGDSLIMTGKEMEVVLSSGPNIGDNISNENTYNDIKITDFKDEQSSKYPLEYLKKFGIVKDFDNVDIEFKKDFPVRITIEDDGLKMVLILAPRVDD